MQDNNPNKSDKSSKINWDLILDDIIKQWKEDFLPILLNKYIIFFVSGILILWWQFKFGVLNESLEFVQKNIITHIPQDDSTSIIVVIVAVIATLYYNNRIFKLDFRPNLNFTSLVFFIGVLYFAERWSGNWVFYYLWKIPIALADVYLFFLFGEVLSWINFLTRSSNDKVRSNKFFKLDDFCDNNDEFQRNGFATEIVEYISNSFGNKSLAVGISGSWGTGKSYLLHQIFKSFEEKNDNSILLVSFNPWRSATSNQIIEDFLKVLKLKLNKYDRSLDNKFQKYLKVLIDNSESDWVKKISDSFPFTQNKPTDQIYNDINDSLRMINKRIVIFIDDLDRLHNDEILEVFRLIRNTADFSNTCFIVAYDREYIQNTFPSINGQLNNYLEKIFQTEFLLPAIDQITIRAELINEIQRRFDDDKIPIAFKNAIIQSKSLYLFPEIIQHKRDIIRFANNFCFDLNTIQDDIELVDFFLVGLLKYRFSGVYKIIFQRSNRDVLLNTFQRKDKRILIIKKSGFEELKKINQHVFTGYNSWEIKLIENLLELIFKKDKSLKINSISYPENFYKYFTLSISPDDIKISEFWDVLQSTYAEAKKTIDEWATQKSNGKFSLMFNNYLIGDFKHKDQIQNYIYGIKKASWNGIIGETIVRFHVALNEGGFFYDGFKEYFKNENHEELENLIVSLIFPEGVSDGFNWPVIEQLYIEGTEGNNLYSKWKSMELVFAKFEQIKKENNYNLLIDIWRTILSSKDFDRWNDRIFELTNGFAELILKNREKFKIIFGSRFISEKTQDESGENKTELVNNLYRKKYNILYDVEDILVIKFLHNPNLDIANLLSEKKLRISFYRELIIDYKSPYHRMASFLESIGPDMKSYTEYNDYESVLIDIYPVKKEEFEQFDIGLFSYLSDKFESGRN